MKPVNPIQVPLHRAPFYFAPEFIPTRDRWVETFSSLLATACEKSGRTVNVVAGKGYQVSADIGLLRFTIDAEGGMFGVEEISDDDLPVLDFFMAEVPATFVKELRSENVHVRFRDDKAVVEKISEWLLRVMKLRSHAAIKNGGARYRARETELGDFVTLDLEQFALFDVDEKTREKFNEPDDDLDTATARFSGTKLYCVCVARTAGALAATSVTADTKGRRGPGRPPTVNHQLLDQVMLEFMRTRGIPDRKKPSWTNAIFTAAVVHRMSELGATVKETTVSQKIRPLIQQFKKAKSGQHLRKLSISEIH